jgi:hypothetical protein
MVLNGRNRSTLEITMSLKFKTDELTAAEASLVAWQFGYHEDDDPFVVSLWQTIYRAWVSDNLPASERRPKTNHLKRLGASGAFPEEVGVYVKFKSPEGEKYWLSLLRKAELTDRRQRSVPPAVERRRRAASMAN